MSRLAVLPQYVLPKGLVTALAGRLASARLGPLTTAAVRWFAGRYRVDLAEAADPDPASYPTFNAFFTRPLRDGARPLAAADLVCPVDGAVSQCGAIAGDRILQAKGHDYTVGALLADDAAARAYDGGTFATIYLSPRDYHRIHMPCAGTLTRMVHVPGALFSVNPTTARGVPGLFARNERVVCHFTGPRGPFALVLVGATVVGSMATAWHGIVNPPRPGLVRAWNYGDGAVRLAQGEEMGRFLLGSTVILCFPSGAASLAADWAEGRPVRMGEAMGTFTA